MMNDRYFVPVCLYPHTAYRASNGVTALFEKYGLNSHDHLIVIADKLLALDRLVTGRYWAREMVFLKARRDSEQVYKLFVRICRKQGAYGRGKIAYWDELAETEQFKEFSRRMRDAFLSDGLLTASLEEFVARRVKRFGLEVSREREDSYEREYLLSEVCMSVYCTEVLGYRNEIWERPAPPDAPDPLRLLYVSRPELLAKVTGHPPERVLDFLFDAICGEIDVRS